MRRPLASWMPCRIGFRLLPSQTLVLSGHQGPRRQDCRSPAGRRTLTDDAVEEPLASGEPMRKPMRKPMEKPMRKQAKAAWRRGRDSNPRYPCEYAAFRVRCFQPLSHLSKPLDDLSIPLRTYFSKGSVATLLLPNRIGASVYYVLKRPVNASSGVFLHARHCMRIKVHRNANLGMP